MQRLTFLCLMAVAPWAACTLDASPNRAGAGGTATSPSQAEGSKWMPEDAFEPRRRITSTVASILDAASAEAPDAATMSEAVSKVDAGDPDQGRGRDASMQETPDAGGLKPVQPDITPVSDVMPTAGAAGGVPVASAGAGAVGAAAAGAAGVADHGAAGAGVAGEGAEGAAGADAAGSGGEQGSVREALIDALIAAVRERGGNVPDDEDWRDRARDGDGLSADFVLSVLRYLRTSDVCWEDTRRCVQVCLVIAQDCEACADDEDCHRALARVCGETIASCNMP